MRMNKRAQITIFIIAALVVIAIVGLLFALKIEKIPFVPGKAETNPKVFMSTCIEEQMKTNINKVLTQGGFINPENYHMANDVKVAYLCYNEGYFKTCINQHPMFLNEISRELKEAISPEIDNCFSEFEKSLEKQGYEINFENLNDIKLSLAPNKVYLDIIRRITITKSGETSSFENIELFFSSSLYELANIANQISNSEAEYCHFEYLGYMALNPEYLILMKVMSDSTKVYSIKDEKTGNEMNIAIKGCTSI